MAEFALLRHSRGADRPPAVWLVEAKSSSPQPETQPNFEQFIDEIRQKLINALHLVLAATLHRHPEAAGDLPAGFAALTLREDFKLVLVIKGHPQAWLEPLQNAMRQAFKSLIKTMGLTPMSIIVMNDAIAHDYGLTGVAPLM